MNIGKFDNRVTIEQAALTSDGAGGTTAIWSTLKETWAEIRPMGKKLVERDKIFQGTAYEIKLRWDSATIANIGDYRVKYGTKELAIHSVTNIDENDNIQLIIALDA